MSTRTVMGGILVVVAFVLFFNGLQDAVLKAGQIQLTWPLFFAGVAIGVVFGLFSLEPSKS